MIWWEGVKNFARAVWEGLKTFVSAVCFHLFFLVVAPFLILLWGFVMSDTVARYVALSGREWKLEGINFILVSVVLATCTMVCISTI
jgi:TMP repeat